MVYALQNWEGVGDWDFIFVIVNDIKILPSFLSSSRLQLKPCYPRKDSSHSILGLRSTLRSRESFNLSTLSSLAISAKPYQIGTTGVMSESLQAKKVEWSSSAFLSFLHLFALVEASCRERNGESNPICLLIRSFVAVIDHDCSQWEGIHDTFNVVLSTVQFVQVFFR